MKVRCESPDCRREIDSVSPSTLSFEGLNRGERLYFCCPKHALWRIHMAINAADRALHDANDTLHQISAYI